MHHHRDVAKHGFGTGGGNGQMGQAEHGIHFDERIADMPHEAVFFFLHHFEVGHGGMQFRVPVDQPLAPVDQPFVVQAHEGFRDRA